MLNLNFIMDKLNIDLNKNRPYLLYISWFIHLIVVMLWINYNPSHLSFQYVFNVKLFDIYLNFGIDGISFFFIYLISFLNHIFFSVNQSSGSNSAPTGVP